MLLVFFTHSLFLLRLVSLPFYKHTQFSISSNYSHANELKRMPVLPTIAVVAFPCLGKKKPRQCLGWELDEFIL